MQKQTTSHSAFFNSRALLILGLCAGACSIIAGTLFGFFRAEALGNGSLRTLTFAERVAYQRAIEDVYWRQRIWPKENPDPKPSLDAVMSQAQLEKKVGDYLRNSQALQDYWQRPITAEQLQAEMDRMAEHTKQPEVLSELFAALGNDPFVIAECLARAALTERTIAQLSERNGDFEQRLNSMLAPTARVMLPATHLSTSRYELPEISATAVCTNDSWIATSTMGAPVNRYAQTAVWTGSEMVVWGGLDQNPFVLGTGGQYNPATDGWTTITTTNAPAARVSHTAVWTGIRMIVWGGTDFDTTFNSGGKYNPATNSWTATSTTNAPTARVSHTAVWTGSEMTVWGGTGFSDYFNTGGKYHPSTDSWSATSTTNAPAARDVHTAIWTGGEMVVWGGYDGTSVLNTGGRYNPVMNSWAAITTTNAPSARNGHTVVWTGTKMIVWGGQDQNFLRLNSGGTYNPSTNSWTGTTITNAPDPRDSHTAVWTGSEMIVWGGEAGAFPLPIFDTGGRYSPGTDSWIATSTVNTPVARELHSAVWTGNEMIVWGGTDSVNNFNTGGRYCAQSPSSTPTPTPTATPTPTPTASPAPTATPTPTPTPTPGTGRCAPTPRPRPSPVPRP